MKVIVVGAGPVGLTCALKLSRAGIDTLLIEAEAELNRELRASTFHSPTLDMLEELGVTATVIRQGLITPTWQVRMHETGERAEFDLSILAGHTRHPYRVQCEQWKLSRMLVTQLTSELWFDTRAVDVRQADGYCCMVRMVCSQGRLGISSQNEGKGSIGTSRSSPG